MIKTFALVMLFALSISLPFTSVGLFAYAQDEISIDQNEIIESAYIVKLDPITVQANQVKAEFPQAPEGNPQETLTLLIKDWRNLSPIAIGILFVLFMVQASKAGWVETVFNFFGWKHVLEWKRFIVTFFGFIYGLLFLISTGSSYLNATVVFILSSGGAVALYEGAKPLLKVLFPRLFNKKDSIKI